MIGEDSLRMTFDADRSTFAELRYATRSEDVIQNPYYRYATLLAQSGIITPVAYTGSQLSKNISRVDFVVLMAHAL